MAVKDIKFSFFLTAVVLLSGALVFAAIKLNEQVSLSQQLNGLLDETAKDRDSLASKNQELSGAVAEKDKLLGELKDVQSMKRSLNEAYANIAKLGEEIEKVKRRSVSLQDENLNLSTRLKSTTKELMEVTENLRLAKIGVSKIKDFPEQSAQTGSLVTLQENIGRLNNALTQKENQIKLLEAKLEGISSAVPGGDQREAIRKLTSEKNRLEEENLLAAYWINLTIRSVAGQ